MKKLLIVLLSLSLFSVSYSKGLWEKYLASMEKFAPPEVNEGAFLEILANRYALPELPSRFDKDMELLDKALLKALNDEEGILRKTSLIFISKFKRETFARPLIQKIASTEDTTEKKWLIWCLGNIARSSDVLAMTAYMRDEKNPYLLNLLAVAIAKIAEKDGSSTPLLLLAENSTNMYIKSTSIIGLGKIGDPKAFPLLIKYAKDHPSKEIRFCSIVALSTIIPKIEHSRELKADLNRRLESAQSAYEKLALAYTIQKVFGFEERLYTFIVGYLKQPLFNEVALDFLEDLPFRQGRDRLEIVMINYPRGEMKERLSDIITKLKGF